MESTVATDRAVVGAYVLVLSAMFWSVGALTPRERWSIVSPFSLADLPMLEAIIVIALILPAYKVSALPILDITMR